MCVWFGYFNFQFWGRRISSQVWWQDSIFESFSETDAAIQDCLRMASTKSRTHDLDLRRTLCASFCCPRTSRVRRLCRRLRTIMGRQLREKVLVASDFRPQQQQYSSRCPCLRPPCPKGKHRPYLYRAPDTMQRSMRHLEYPICVNRFHLPSTGQAALNRVTGLKQGKWPYTG